MITKKEFEEFLKQYNKFNEAISRMEEAISGKSYRINLYETDWSEAVEDMLFIFLKSHFTEAGIDWITYYLFEDIEDKLVTVTIPADIFEEEKEIEYHLNSLDELWDFLLTDKKLYFKYAE